MKKFVSILLTLMMIASMASMVFALPAGLEPNANSIQNNQLTKPANTILSYIQYIGYAIAVGMLLYIGIKYMMSSANEKADVKKGAVNWVIGAIVIAGAVTIAKAVTSIGGQF